MRQETPAAVIGERLRTLRGARKQEEIAKAIGITQTALSRYESGERIPRDLHKIALARFYQTTVEAVFYD